MARRRQLVRGVRPAATVARRSVIVTDDGIATGSTMLAALQAVQAQQPLELIVAVPIGPPTHLEEVRRWCDEVVCLLSPPGFRAIGQFYEDFSQVGDEQVLALLRESTPAQKPSATGVALLGASEPSPRSRLAAGTRRHPICKLSAS
jgi:predicted phosphoribosyltransferase